MKTIVQRIAEELSVQENQVQAAMTLLDEGATVPFIARYRKEVTGGLDDIQLRTLEERLHYIRDLDDRRETILNTIREQEKLTPELEAAIQAAETKTRLEDLYLPYKPKRRSKAKTAKEAGLEWFGNLGAEFVSAYEAAYDEEPSYHSMGGYVAGQILEKAIIDADSIEPEAIKNAMDGMDILTGYGRIKFDISAEAHGLQIGHSMIYIQWQKDDAGNLVKQVVWPL